MTREAHLQGDPEGETDGHVVATVAHAVAAASTWAPKPTPAAGREPMPLGRQPRGGTRVRDEKDERLTHATQVRLETIKAA